MNLYEAILYDVEGNDCDSKVFSSLEKAQEWINSFGANYTSASVFLGKLDNPEYEWHSIHSQQYFQDRLWINNTPAFKFSGAATAATGTSAVAPTFKFSVGDEVSTSLFSNTGIILAYTLDLDFPYQVGFSWGTQVFREHELTLVKAHNPLNNPLMPPPPTAQEFAQAVDEMNKAFTEQLLDTMPTGFYRDPSKHILGCPDNLCKICYPSVEEVAAMNGMSLDQFADYICHTDCQHLETYKYTGLSKTGTYCKTCETEVKL